jgi:2'-5' RNA ligase
MRLFVAAWPPPEVLAAIRDLPRPDHEGVRWTPEDQWHVTLRFMGDVADPDPVIASLRGELPGRGARDATLAPATSLLGGHLVVGVDGLASLSTLVRLATAAYGDPPLPQPFEGHVTLARGRRRTSLTDDLVDDAVNGGAPLTWSVDEVALVASDLGPPLTYETIATIPLDA